MMKVGAIHASHFGPGVSLAYAPADAKRQTVPWVEYRNENRGVSRTYAASGASADELEKLSRFQMQCTDCHNCACPLG